MNLIIGISGILMVLTCKVCGVSLISLGAIITWVLFAARKVGYFVKPKTVFTLEGILIFVNIVLKLLLSSISWTWVLKVVILRGLFFVVLLYEVKNYVYIKKEVRRE